MKKTPADWRRFRARRKEQGRPVARGSSSTESRRSKRFFVAWDGEGVTDKAGIGDPQPHRYVMMANSLGHVLESHNLGTKECLDFLLDSEANVPGAIHCIYGGSYDVTMIFREVSGREKFMRIGKAWYSGKDFITAVIRNKTNAPVFFDLDGRSYTVQYRPRKFLRITRFAENAPKYITDGKGKRKPNYDAAITLWDVIGFFQQRFVDALQSYKIKADIAAIEQMKQKRSEFSDTHNDETKAYCLSECNALADLMECLAGYLDEANLTPSRWDGPGAIASTLLRREGIKASIEQEPEHLKVPVAQAFFGGRIELLQMGNHQAPLFSYDIASAYPGAIMNLPDLRGQWVQTKSPAGFSVCRIRYEFPEGMPWYPIPYRNKFKQIIFGTTGDTWVWRPEYEACLAWMALHGGSIEVLECWELQGPDWKPLGFVGDIFSKRQLLKRGKIGSEKSYKLAMNSIFGKTCQQVGATEEKLPPFLTLCWAGWITSSTRARLVEAGMYAPHSVVAFCTDGIYATEPLDLETVDVDALPEERVIEALGAWEPATVYDQGVFVQAGVYWLLRRGKWVAKFRGFDKEAMELPTICLDGWLQRKGSVVVPTTRFITYGSALASAELWPFRATWRTADRVLDLSGKSAKRQAWTGDISRPAYSLVALAPKHNEWYESSGEQTRPYDSVTIGENMVDGVAASQFSGDVEDTEYA